MLRECLTPPTIVGNNALDIMETNSGLWNTEAKEATEDGNVLPGFSFGKDPFVSSNSQRAKLKDEDRGADHGLSRG